MTLTIRVPSLRTLALTFVGIVLGATLVAPVTARVVDSAVEPSATQTRTASCHGFDFMPVTSGISYGISATSRVSPSGGVFVCDPGLPNRAVVSRVRFTVGDGHPLAQVSNCALVRNGLTPTTVLPAQVLGSVPPTGLDPSPGTVRLNDSSINFATVNNAKYAYWLQCELSGTGTALYGADVTYFITSANG